MTAQILVLSSQYDFSIDIVLRRLREMNVTYLRLNREQMSDLRISLDPVDRTLTVRGLGIKSTIGPDMQSIWYRSPVFIRNTPGNKLAIDAQLSRSQWSAFLRSMMVFDSARWMNHPADIYKAETKPFQLLVASRCGFLVPATTVGNDVQAIQKRFSSRIAVKSIDTVYLREGNDALFAYTNIIQSYELSDANVHQAPLIAQVPISPKADIRVTVVGSSVFAHRILINGTSAAGDWRLHKRNEISYEPYSLSDDVKTRCIALCSKLNLSFGAIDLIESEGEVVFIEINPTGEWAWLPNADQTTGEAIAAWLSVGPT